MSPSASDQRWNMAKYSDYKAKKTFYRGKWYDSNFEAKVAESLDDHGVAYEYQRQCFRDKSFPWGQFTPDFHIPDARNSLGIDTGMDFYVEVAGVFDGVHKAKVDTLSRMLSGMSYVCVIRDNGNCTTYSFEHGDVVQYANWPTVLQEVAEDVRATYGC